MYIIFIPSFHFFFSLLSNHSDEATSISSFFSISFQHISSVQKWKLRHIMQNSTMIYYLYLYYIYKHIKWYLHVNFCGWWWSVARARSAAVKMQPHAMHKMIIILITKRNRGNEKKRERERWKNFINITICILFLFVWYRACKR